MKHLLNCYLNSFKANFRAFNIESPSSFAFTATSILAAAYLGKAIETNSDYRVLARLRCSSSLGTDFDLVLSQVIVTC